MIQLVNQTIKLQEERVKLVGIGALKMVETTMPFIMEER